TIAGVNDPELLLENVESTANLLVKATSGQYIDKNEINDDFYLRSEGGINIMQLIKDYADEIKKNNNVADQYFFEILQYVLEIKQDSYRSGFKIWQHSLEWTSKKSFRLGYIFFGNPNERSTTEPIQQYYIFFCPLFNSINRNDESDEVYFDFSGLSDEFKDVVYRYGAAKAKHISASSNHKKLFEEQIDDLLSIAIKLFDKEYIDKTNVIYKGETKPLKSYPLLSEGSSKEMIFYKLSANLLNNCFNDKYPDYPSFTNLNQTLTKENFEERVKSALRKIVSPDKENRDGEAVLNGLGLYNGQYIDIQNSKYADSIISLFKNSSTETVINRSDILYPHYADANLWYSIEYNIEYQLVFIVLTALVFKGEIEIFWSPNKVLSATNIDTVTNFNNEDYFTFQHIKKPKGLPVKSLKALFTCLNLPDYSLELDKPQTISSIVSKAKEMVEKVVTTINLINNGISCKDVPLLNIQEKTEKKDKLDELKTMLDNIQSYNTSGKLKLFKYTEEELLATFEAYKYCYEIDKLKEKKDRFEKLITYLLTAKAFIEEDSALLKKIEDAINKLGDHLLNSSESELKKYETILNALKDEYATYYMDKYVKYRMSTKDANIKEKLMKSDDKKVWDNLKDIGILNSLDYNKIIDNIRSLKVADPNLRKQNILEDPYFDFNPRDYKDKIAYRISDLEEELEKIYDKWTKAVKSFLKDPSVKDNIDILPEKDKKIIETLSQQDAHIDLSMSERLKHIIPQLSEGIDKIEISMEKFKNEIDKPVTPEEAIDFFTKYIDSLCSGKERKKIRIIIK
ncbi:MAG: DUF6079 family protein, partial [Candidatus Muirbacterium halophilum]|nr:DUF6079 family protein [Candidatus Muirbacterium halophilum]